jgi:serine/threonine-protein kinase
MAEVYEARDTRLDRAVAVKVLPDRLVDDPQFRGRFEREARTISRLNHPCICTLYDVGQHERAPYLVMELVEGETLRAWLRRVQRPDVAAVIRIGLQCAQALATAHAAGIVHRDIKPENVIVRPDGSIKVLDFGIAKLVASVRSDATEVASRQQETHTGMVVGTTAYMSPEQARGVPVDARSDVFSLGVLLYELLDGHAPFVGTTPTDVTVAILQYDPPPLTRQRPEIGSDFADVIAMCLAKDPERRFESGRALAEALEPLERTHSGANSGPPSIAVLPLVNLSNDRDNEYFCDGIAEDLMNGLAKIRGLHVAARTSSFAFKGRPVDLKEIGRVLNVRTVLEGSVRKAGERLRITAQLVNIADGYQLWSERYDRDLKDVFAIQDEISVAIVTALKGKLLGEEHAALIKRGTKSVEAFELYARGRHHWNGWSADGLAKAQECMERAIALDPKYALAYVGLADCYLARQAAGFSPSQPMVAKARTELSRALALDPNLDMAWTLLGVAHFTGWDFEAAHGAVARALELNPLLGHAHLARAATFGMQGRFSEAAESAARAVELDPLAPMWSYLLAIYLIGAGDLAEAERRARAVLEFDAGAWAGHLSLGLVRYARRDYGAAVGSFENAVRLSGGMPQARSGLIAALAHAGERERAERELAALLADAASGHVPGSSVAAACAGLGLADQVFEWLDKAIDGLDTWVRMTSWNPLFAEIREDSRMLDVMRRLGLDEGGRSGTLTTT